MNKASCRLFIIDDDPSVRKGISLLMNAAGYYAESFRNAEEFLELENFTGHGCIILDIFMDGRSGLELQEEIGGKFKNLPIIYLTGQGNIPMSVQAIKKGAVNFLQKPVNDQELLDAVANAIVLSRKLTAEYEETEKIRLLLGSLTIREFEIYRLLITGRLNKQIAAELGIAEHTVKLHRGKITKKLNVKSVAELVLLSQKLFNNG
jgi:FixJ family two-component response regulator